MGARAMETSVGAGEVTVTLTVAVRPEAVWVAVTVEVPAATPVTTPAALTAATDVEEETNVELEVRLPVEESVKVPVTVSACVPPTPRLTGLGVRPMEASVGAGAVTVTRTVAVRPEAVWVAVIVAAPAATPVTIPAALTAATDVEEETNVELEVRLAVEESVKVPVRVNACVPLTPRLTGLGVRAMEASVGGGAVESVTYTITLAVRPLAVAEITALPAETAVTAPEVLTTATPGELEVNVAPELTGVVVPSP
jgi:uncharacterized protein YndB with AHSA1/START domain